MAFKQGERAHGQIADHLQKVQWAQGHFPFFLSALLCEPAQIHKWKVLPLFLDMGVSEQSECLEDKSM
jgi:hypothetical protein